MSGPMFSIIIPVYNTEKELERCVRSVTNQTFRNLEIILVDDGSRDNSEAICDALAAEDERIKVIHQKNSGCSEARNSGIRAANGEYLLFLDSDDMWDETDAMERLCQIIEEKPVDVICFGVKIYEDDGIFVKARIPEEPKKEDNTKEEVLRGLIYSNQYFSASYVKALKREFFFDNELFFLKGLLSGEDGEWSARIMVTCRSIAVFQSAFYRRIRRKEGGITSAIGKKNILDVFAAIDNGLRFVDQRAENEALKQLYLEYWAYQYAMLFGLAYRLHSDSEYPALLEHFRKYKWLLRYDHVKKVKAVRWLTSVAGIRGALRILSLYYRAG
ncbi:MAG: glycosyltransferase family 2 protein [Clostridia bacterium]|nr:glycosyltransferase family 2 protein [Clostridia bacterium]